jgi:hypothetical protein
MPISLTDLFGKAEGHSREANRASGRAAELEQELAREREAQKAAEREAQRAAREANAEQKRVEKDLTARVDALERSLPGVRSAAKQAVEDEGTPPPDLRQMARLWLRGSLNPGYELMPAEQPITQRDGAANTWLAAQTAAAPVAALVYEGVGLGELFDRSTVSRPSAGASSSPG